MRIRSALMAVALLVGLLTLPTVDAQAQAGSGLVFSEIHYNPPGQVEGHEFVELYNAGTTAIDLTNWSLAGGIEHVFAPGTIVAAGGRLVGAANAAEFQAVFGAAADFDFVGALSNSTDTLQIVNPVGTVVEQLTYFDTLPWPTSPDGDGDSLVRLDTGAIADQPQAWIAGIPTPGTQDQPNATVLFSVERGWYSASQTVTLTPTVAGAQIVYGTAGDGNPSTPYTGPISIANNGSVQVLQAAVVIGGAKSTTVTHSYVFGPDNGVPTVLMWPNGRAVAPDEIEETRSFEFIPPPSTGLVAVGADAGTTTSQGGVKAGTSDKVFFRGAYGAGTLNADLFSDRYFGTTPVPEIDQLVLRARHSDYSETKLLISHDTQLAMGNLAPHGRFVTYWKDGLDEGFRQLLERPEGGFMEAYTDIDKSLWRAWSRVDFVSGSNYDVSWFGAPYSSWADLEQSLDPQNFADFLVANWQANTLDYYPDRNWRVAGPLDPNQGNGADYRFNFFSWDMDYAYVETMDWNGNSEWMSPHHLLLYVDDFPQWRTLMSDRIACHHFNGGSLTPEAWQQRLALRQPEAQAIGNTEALNLYSFLSNEYVRDRNIWMMEQYRKNAVSEESWGFIGPAGLEPEMPMLAESDPLTVDVTNGVLSISGAAGLPVYYRLDGDPRTPDGQLDPAAIEYTGPVSLPSGRHRVIARTLDASFTDVVDRWSPACNDGQAFDVIVSGQPGVSPGAGLAITEIHYNPPTVDLDDGDQYEFIELFNTTTSPINATEFAFNDGVRYVFPAGTTIAPGEYFVIASDGAKFQSRYGFAPDGVYDGRLDDGGETLTLVDAVGAIIDTVTWDDVAPWPTAPDAGGPSLSRIQLAGDGSNDPTHWAASATIAGTPGAQNDSFVGVMGDVDCSNDVGLLDARSVAQYAIDARTATTVCPLASPGTQTYTPTADVDNNGSISLLDARLIAQCAVGASNVLCP